ncbi:protein adenylyltransferase SelO-1 [Huso huso]|uniref:Protein adenylyltransferase SelO-1 n=1 Tax=Huso huso TaxID=61971 RepID=A0ABR0ZU99_HUSHU
MNSDHRDCASTTGNNDSNQHTQQCLELEVNRVLKVLESPYSEQTGLHRPGSVHQAGSSEEESSADSASAPSCLPYDSKPPAWASELAVT